MTPNARAPFKQRLDQLKERLDLGALLFAPYILVLVWQYLATLQSKLLAWSLAVFVSLVIWFVYISIKETEPEKLSLPFWLLVALPLLLIYLLRIAFPDLSFDVLSYHIFNSERTLRGPLFIRGDLFPVAVTFNPTPDLLTGVYRYVLGYRLGTVVNLFALVWTGALLYQMLREYFRSRWMRSLCVLFILFTEQILFQINNYMVDLLALPLLLEATRIVIAARDHDVETNQTLRLAFLLGVATAFKLTNLFFAVPIVLVYLFNLATRESGGNRRALLLKLVKWLPITAVVFVAPSVPFTLLIYRATGNPIFPLYNGLFKSPFWPQGAVLDPRWGPWGAFETIVWPVMLLFKAPRLSEFLHYSGRLSLGYVAAAICLLIGRRDRKTIEIAFITLVGALLWSASSGYIRYALYLELTSGLLLVWITQRALRTSRGLAHSVTHVGVAVLLLVMIVQSAVALRYISRWEWSTRPTIFKAPDLYLHETKTLFRDRSLPAFQSREELAMFDDVDVWIETTYKTSALAALLKPKTPCIGVRMLNNFLTNAARQKFSDALGSQQGKRMFTLTTAESIEEARSLLAARGLSMLSPRPVSIYYFSDTLKFDLFLAEIVTSRQTGSATGRAEKGVPLPDQAFKAGLSTANVPTIMKARQKYSISVSLRNDSQVIWPGLQPTWKFQVTVGDIWLTETGSMVNNMDGRVTLVDDLAPSQTVGLPLTVTAPAQPGIYILQLDAIQEGVAWFGDRGSEVLNLKIRVE